MANFRLAASTQNGLADKLSALISGGTVTFYDGIQPDDANTLAGEQRVLATLTFGEPAFGAAMDGTITAAPITQRNATATGTCTWARVADAAGNAVFDCDVAEKGDAATIVLNTTHIVEQGPVVITSFTISVPSG